MNRQGLFEQSASIARINRYLTAYAGDWDRAERLYLANINLSSRLFSVLCMFEVTLRNSIDRHYNSQFAGAVSPDWLVSQSGETGFLSHASLARGGFQSRQNVLKITNDLGGRYTHDRAVSELNFGFWKYMFASKEFAAAGSTLLRIFPARPRGINHTDVYNRLNTINRLRNRIAHHQPICFDRSGNVSVINAEEGYNHALSLLAWLGFDPTELLLGVDNVPTEFGTMRAI